MKKILLIVVFALITLTACNGNPPDSGQDEARKEKLQKAAEMRAKFKESELLEYGIKFMRNLFSEVYPDVDIDKVLFSFSKTEPTESEVAELHGDEERAYELLKKGDFTISITDANYNSIVPYDERKMILDALGERGFTVHLEMGFEEYAYVVNGEVHLEPKPMY